MAVKKNKRYDDEELHITHPDEKWLVSYSDMMTLLFGFFVLLFSLAVKNKGNFNSGLKEISKEMTQSVEAVPAPSVETIPLVEFNKLKSEKQKVDEEIEQLKQKIVQLSVLFQNQPQANQDLQKQIQESTDLKEQLTQTQQQNQQKDIELTELKNLLEALKSQKITANESTKIDSAKDLTAAVQKITELEQLLQDLRTRNYMMAYIKWDTEKHDIDMTVKDPAGHLFNYKNRSFVNVAGNLILDSRYGPGAEVWNSNKLEAGIYEITASLYNQFGNPNDAVLTGSIITAYGVLELPKAYLNMKDNPSFVYKVQVTAEGKLSLK
jgi:flagellar motor protein MotB